MFYNILLSGTKGMNKAVWKKFDKAKFGVAQTEVKRPMGEWECCLIQVGKKDADNLKKFPSQLAIDTIGQRL